MILIRTDSRAGVWGVPGYLSEGFWQEMKRRISTRSDAEIIAGRIRQGEEALRGSSPEEQKAILHHWKGLKQHGMISTTASSQQSLNPEANSAPAKTSADADLSPSANMAFDHDSLILQAIEAHLRRQTNINRPGTFGPDDDTASSVVSTSTQHTSASRQESACPVHPESHHRHTDIDDPDVESEDDENMKEALLRSRLEH